MIALKRLTAIMVILSCTSCATVAPKPIYYKCPKIKLPNPPVLAISEITDKSTDDFVAKAYFASVSAQHDYILSVNTQVDNSQ